MLQKTKYALCDVGIIFNTYGVEVWSQPFCFLSSAFPTQLLGIIFNTYGEEGMACLLLCLIPPQMVGYYF